MVKKFEDKKIFIATNNQGKIDEFKALFTLLKLDIEIVTPKDLNIESPPETGINFFENSLQKAMYYCDASGLVAIADDSGLAIDALKGEPGVYSADWADGGKNFPKAFRKIEKLLGGKAKKPAKAKFVCGLTICWPDNHFEYFEEEISGTISFPPKGAKGFGYDPLFTPEGYNKTFAELGGEEKNKISHRARALRAMAEYCF